MTERFELNEAIALLVVVVKVEINTLCEVSLLFEVVVKVEITTLSLTALESAMEISKL